MIRAGLLLGTSLVLGGCGDPAPPPAPAPAAAPDSPDWAPGLSSTQAREFLERVLDYFVEREITVRVVDGWIVRAETGADEQYGLTNLSQRCGQAAAGEWPELIAAHFDVLLRRPAESARWERELRALATARKYLRIRIYPSDYALRGAKLVQRRDLPETWTVLVLDLPSWIQSVSSDDLARWQCSVEEAWRIAAANQRATDLPPGKVLDLPEGPKLAMYEGDSHFVASEALSLDRLPGAVGRHGALVGIPTRNVLLALPIEDARAIAVVSRLAQNVPKIFDEGPGSVSPHLYWWDGERFHLIAITREGGQTAVTPSEAFVELLNRLGGAEASDTAK